MKDNKKRSEGGAQMKDNRTHHAHEHHHHPSPSEPKHAHPPHTGHDKHAGHTPEMFRDRFFVSLLLTLPILYFSEQLQDLKTCTYSPRA